MIKGRYNIHPSDEARRIKQKPEEGADKQATGTTNNLT